MVVQPGAQMAAEMAEQPAVLAAFAARRHEVIARVRQVVSTGPAGIVLIGRGSSDNAAIFGRYVLQMATGVPVSLAAPSLHTLYNAPLRAEGWLAIAVSQSGKTPEIHTVLERFRKAGAVAIAITNDADSPLWHVADAGVALDAGAEQAVPATKTFTAQIAALATIAEALGPVPWTSDDWDALPQTVQTVLDDLDSADQANHLIGEADALFAVGRGLAFAVALEAALKLKETTGILAEGISAADLRHGPIAVVGRTLPVLAYRLPGPTEADLTDLCNMLHARGAPLIDVACDANAALPLPSGLAEALLTIPATVRGQQLALTVTRHRGMDPDSPAGLTKVTFTS